MNKKIFDFIESDESIEILENTYDNNLVLKTEYTILFLKEILESEFISNDSLLLEIEYYFNFNVLDFIKLNKNEYIIIINLN